MRQERLMNLERELSGLAGYEGWMIGKCRFFFGAETEQVAVPGEADAREKSAKFRVLRSGSRLAEVEILRPAANDRLLVTLIDPVRETEANVQHGRMAESPPDIKEKQENEPGRWFVAERADVDAYLEASGDNNPIHQDAHAVVPGFFMVNRIALGTAETAVRLQCGFIIPCIWGSCKAYSGQKRREEKRGTFYRAGEDSSDDLYLRGKKYEYNDENSEERNHMDNIRDYDHGTYDDHADRLHLHKNSAPIYFREHYCADTGGESDRHAVCTASDCCHYGKLDPLSVMGIGGSLGKLLGPAGGYRYGNAVAAILIALFCRKVKNLKAQTAFLIFVGIPVIYLFGAVQMKIVTNQPWPAIMVQAVLPFIPLDVVKCFVAAGLAKILRRIVPQF